MMELVELFRKGRAPSGLFAFFAATLVALLALALRLALDDLLAGYPFILFFPAVILVAWLFGWPAGLYTVLLSTVLAFYFVLARGRNFGPAIVEGFVPMLAFMLGAGGAVFLMEALRVRNERLHVAIRELEEALTRAEKAEHAREMLLREVDHRIANKLQLLASTLSIQARFASTETASILRAAVQRIHVLGRIHNALIARDGAQMVDVRRYLNQLCADLQLSIAEGRSIIIRAEIAILEMPVARITTIGLLVNELVTNAVKHAFRGCQQGEIVVRFSMPDAATCRLEVCDNGIGVDAPRDGFGMTLIRTLVGQLQGQLEIQNASGAVFRITFPR